MISNLFHSSPRSRIRIVYVLPGGVILSGMHSEDLSGARFKISIDARRKHVTGLTYITQIAPGLFSYRFEDPIRLDPSDARARVRLFDKDLPVAFRRMKTAVVFGAIDAVVNDQVRGWVCQAFRGVTPAIPELVINDVYRIPIICTRFRMDVSPLTAGDPLVGFQVPLPRATPAAAVRTVEIRVQDTVVAKFDSSGTQHQASSQKEKFSGQAPDDDDDLLESIARSDAIRRLKAEVRTARLDNDLPRLQRMRQKLAYFRDPNGMGPVEVKPWLAKAHDKSHVSVIIPVYRDLPSLRRCMDHLLRSQAVSPFDILVVNDCSPDTDVHRYLTALSKKRAITLVENQRNLGFVGTVNVALQSVPPTSDVVLLNSDAFVPLGWLEKLAALAYSEPHVASVTPMSNAATIFSYPQSNRDNPMPPGIAVDALDERFSRAAEMLGYSSVEVPTGVGFCMYLTRQALDEVGGFAEEFSPGYGEENDWCKRAEDCGLRNLGAANTFVEHLGSMSFSEKREQLISAHMDVLNAKYPEYKHEVTDFINKDPFAVFRAAADLLAQIDSKKKAVIHLLHGWGGGIAEHIADIIRYTNELALHIVAASDRHDSDFLNVRIGQLDWVNKISRPSFLRLIRGASDIPHLDAYLHFHSTIGMISHTRQFTGLPGFLKVATIHDYSLRCPRIFLLTVGDRFCGLPEVETCERCIRIVGPLKGLEEEYAQLGSVHRWVAEGARFLSSMDRVTGPSRDLCSRFPFPPGIRASVVAHPEGPIEPFAITQPRKPLRVGVLGAIGPHKGSRAIGELAETIELRDLPIKLFIVGYTDDDKRFEDRSMVTITGPYEKRTATVLLQSLELDFVLIPSIWPETFSFTVSEAWSSALPVMTIFEGGHSDRVMAAQGFGYFPLEALQPDDLVGAILAFAGELENRVGDIVRPAVVSPSDWFEMTYR
jgi:GT2 family glycosyltransferase/glycosyltransferase involved in cell wall biosynthesis